MDRPLVWSLLPLTCSLLVVGCGETTQNSRDTKPIPFAQASLDFRSAPTSIEFTVEVVDDKDDRVKDVRVALRLFDVFAQGDRVIMPESVDDGRAGFKIQAFHQAEVGTLWVYSPSIGLSAFQVSNAELRQPWYGVRISRSTNEETTATFYGEDRQPLQSRFVGVSRLLAVHNGVTVASEVPEELWKDCRVVTDHNGKALFPLAYTIEATEFRLRGVRLGEQLFSVAEDAANKFTVAETGTVRLAIEDEVNLEAVKELRLFSDADATVRGFHHIRHPQHREFEVTMTTGLLEITATFDDDKYVLVPSTPGPWHVRAGETTEVSITTKLGCRVTGRLVSETDDGLSPVAGAGVYIRTINAIDRGGYVRTSADGRFSACVPEGTLEIGRSVYSPYATLWLEQDIERSIASSDRQVDLGDLRLPQLLSLEGTITDGNGNPLRFTSVSCSESGHVVGGGRTNERGNFVVLTQSLEIDQFLVWPRDIFGRYDAEVLRNDPLTLQVKFPWNSE